jgi:hypothetical protein
MSILYVSLLKLTLSYESVNNNSGSIIDMHCGDVIRSIANDNKNIKIFYRYGKTTWWKDIPIGNNASFLYVGFIEPLMKSIINDSKLYDFFKSFTKVYIWFDDIDLWKINNIHQYQNYIRIIRTFNPIFLHPVQDISRELNSYGLNSMYVNWTAQMLEKMPLIKKPSDQLIIFFDHSDRFESSFTTSKDILETILSMLLVHRIPLRLHCSTDKYIPNKMKTMPNVTITHGKVKYKDLIQLLLYGHIYLTNIRSSYEFTVLESQLLGNHVIQYGDCLRTEHYGGDHVHTCNTKKDLQDKIIHIWELLQKGNFDPNIIRDIAKNKYGFDKSKQLLKQSLKL